MTVIIDDKGSVLYAAQLYEVLSSDDPRKALGDPIRRSVIMSLLADLASGAPRGAFGDQLRDAVSLLRRGRP